MYSLWLVWRVFARRTFAVFVQTENLPLVHGVRNMGRLVAPSESAQFMINLPRNLVLKIERVERDEDEAEHETVYQQRYERSHALLLPPLDWKRQLALIFPDPFYDCTHAYAHLCEIKRDACLLIAAGIMTSKNFIKTQTTNYDRTNADSYDRTDGANTSIKASCADG